MKILIGEKEIIDISKDTKISIIRTEGRVVFVQHDFPMGKVNELAEAIRNVNKEIPSDAVIFTFNDFMAHYFKYIVDAEKVKQMKDGESIVLKGESELHRTADLFWGAWVSSIPIEAEPRKHARRNAILA